MLDRLWKSVRKLVRKSVSDELSDELVVNFHLGNASALRRLLKASVDMGDIASSEILIRLADEHGWSDVEKEKLQAYYEFYTGNSAQAYQRLLIGGLAVNDFELFMTGCVYCYLHDRFEEGYVLLQHFDASCVSSGDLAEFAASAGYIARAGGGSIDESIAYFDMALSQGLHSVSLVVNSYLSYFEAGRHDRVMQLSAIIHEHYSADPEAEFALACVELARNYYPEGFRLAEARYRMPELTRAINSTLLAYPRWQGESLQGKRLLVHGEQGLGDLIMMSRYFPLLHERGAELIVDCREVAISIMQQNFPFCKFVPGDQKSAITEDFDIWCGVMSLPYYFNNTAENIPKREGYISIPEDQKEYWAKRLTGFSGLKVGLAWSGNPGHRADRRRSLPFTLLEPFLKHNSDVNFFPLQTVVPDELPVNVVDTSDELATLADTFALISELDLIITVDTAVVHAAGALGKPTWLLLPYRYEWRWGLEGERNNWYESVRVCRQQKHGAWVPLLEDIFIKRLRKMGYVESETEC